MLQKQIQTQKIKLDLNLSNVVDVVDISITNGEIVYPDEFEEFFEDVDDIYKFFDEDEIIAAIVSEDYVYFITFNKPLLYPIGTLSIFKVRRAMV